MGRKAITEPVREMINATLDGVFGHFVDAVALHRKLPKEKVLELVDEGHLKADWALEQQAHRPPRLLGRGGGRRCARRLGIEADEKVKCVTSAQLPQRSARTTAGLPEGEAHLRAHLLAGPHRRRQGRQRRPFGGGDNQGSTPIINALRKARRRTRT